MGDYFQCFTEVTAGKSRTASFLEDMGFYCVDNLPAEMMAKFADFCAGSSGRYDRVALVYDVRAGEPFDLLIETLEEGPDDILGDVYMKADMGSKAAGQFFTPFHLSELCARTGLIGMIDEYKAGKLDRITISEPACGGGAMILAAAKVLYESGINYQTAMEVVAQDIDWKGVYMCYVQLSLLGISAICVQGSTLEEPYDPARTERSHILRTPRKAGLLV